MIGVTENLKLVKDLLARAARDAGRDAAAVRLLAVSKRQPPERILEAAVAGQRDFGENVVQEALPKIERTAGNDLVWHFIGRLQRNKTRAVAERFDWVHSIDRLQVAERLSRQRPDDLAPLNVCLQVDLDDEPAKDGAAPVDVPGLARSVSELPRLRLRGLMCIPAVRDDFEAQRKPFRVLRELADFIRNEGIELDTLSMGMSGDYRAAVFEGATIVRIGTAIFGERTA
mgnify:FL=1